MSRNGEAVPAPAKPNPEEAERIREQLERLLASALFRSSRRCQTLLRHITERALAGEGATLKERTLGIDAFGRAPDYDTNQDPIVRGAAGEIRKKLAQYYQNPEHRDELQITLPLGSYVPEFHRGEATAVPVVRHRTSRAPVLASAAILAVAGAAIFLLVRSKSTDFELFWRPMLDSQAGVLFCLPQSRVYSFRSDATQNEFEKKVENMPDALLASSRESIPVSQLIPVWDRYVAWGDMDCLRRLTALFEQRGKQYIIRGKSATTFTDLRERPAVLIGAFDNEWTLRVVGQLRFTFFKDFQRVEMVRDRYHPDKTDWKLIDSWPQWNIQNDYAIVSRVLDRSTGRMVVIAAGITHFGTMGAGEFLSDPQYFSEVARLLPSGWKDKNLQFVLRVPVVRGASAHPQVVATHVW